MSTPRKLTYSSTAIPDDAVSTEGVQFTIDEEEFTCHGRVSAFDLSEFAGPAADAGDDVLDAGVVRLLADMMRMVLGDDTYRAVTRHRRKHQTPDSVMQQLLIDVVEAVADRPSGRPSPSQGGRPDPASPPAVSPSPVSAPPGTDTEWEPWTPPVPAQTARPGGGMGMIAALAQDGDIRFSTAPADVPAGLQGKRPATVRRMSLAHPERGVQVEQQ